MIIPLIDNPSQFNEHKTTRLTVSLLSLSEGMLGRVLYRFNVECDVGETILILDEISFTEDIRMEICIGSTAVMDVITDINNNIVGYKSLEILDSPWANPWKVSHSN